MTIRRHLGICVALMLLACATERSTARPYFDQENTITLGAGRSVILAHNQRIKVQSGAVAAYPPSASGGMILNGHGETLCIHPGAIVSAPADATGSADNLVIAFEPNTPASAPASASTAGIVRKQCVSPSHGMLIVDGPPPPWLSELPAIQPSWRKIQSSLYSNLGNDSEAMTRLADSSSVEDTPEIPASKSLICEPQYKKYLVRSLFFVGNSFLPDGNTTNVYEAPNGLVVNPTWIGGTDPQLDKGALAVCLKAPPQHIEGVVTQQLLWPAL